MTATATPEQESPSTAPATPRGRTTTWVVAALALALVVVGWRVAGGQVLDQAYVEISRADCTGGAVARIRTPAAVLTTTRDMRCTLTVTVYNGGPVDVHLADARGALLGVGNATIVRIETIDGSTPRGGSDAVDALHDLGRTVPAGSRTSFDVVLTFNPRACGTAGTLGFPGFPLIDASTLGVRGTIGTEGRLVVRNAIEIQRCLD